MSSKRSLEERINEKNEMKEKALEKVRQYEAQLKMLEKKQKEADRKARTHRLITIGGVVEAVLGREFRDGDNKKLENFLRTQERNGRFFTKAMEKDIPDDKESDEKKESCGDENGL